MGDNVFRAAGEEVPEVEDWAPSTLLSMVAAGCLIYEADEGETYAGPLPLHPWAAYGVPKDPELRLPVTAETNPGIDYSSQGDGESEGDGEAPSGKPTWEMGEVPPWDQSTTVETNADDSSIESSSDGEGEQGQDGGEGSEGDEGETSESDDATETEDTEEADAESTDEESGSECPTCGAKGDEPCISQKGGHELKNHHPGRN